MRTLTILWFVIAGTCVAAPTPNDQIVYNANDCIYSAAQRAGIRVDEERGMGCFGLVGKGYRFAAYLPTGSCFPTKHEQKTEEKLTLSYTSSRKQVSLATVNEWNRSIGPAHLSPASVDSDGTASLQSILVVEYGVSTRTISEHMRRFVAEIRQFEAHLKQRKGQVTKP